MHLPEGMSIFFDAWTSLSPIVQREPGLVALLVHLAGRERTTEHGLIA